MQYCLPTDDLVYRLQPTITASAEDTNYPVTNWYEVNPAKPSKLTTTTGSWIFDFGTAVNGAVFSPLYHNFDAGLSVIWKWNSSNSWGAPAGTQSLTVPTVHEDGWTISPWSALSGTPTYRYWKLDVGSTGPANSAALSLGRPFLGGALRSFSPTILWTEPIPEDEDWGLIEQKTELGVETIYPLGGKRRMLTAHIGGNNTQAASIQSLRRSVQGRTYAFLAIPPHVTNDAWFVRFEDPTGRRSYKFTNWNLAPFTIREVSRGLPWP